MPASDGYSSTMGHAYSGELMQVYVLVGEKQSGPFTIEQIRGLWNKAAITSDAYYWHAGLENWEPLVVLMKENNLADHVEEGSKVAATLPSDNKANGSGHATRTQEFSGQTKKDRKQVRKAMVAAVANKTGRPEPSGRDRANSDDSPEHSFGADGKCMRCGSTRGAVEHFGFSCNTFDSPAARGRLGSARTASSKTRQSAQRSSHLPYCSSCRCRVNPSVVSRNRTGPGAAFAMGDGYAFAQRSTSELIKVCPKCGERVYTAGELDEFKRRHANDEVWLWVLIGIVVVFIIIFAAIWLSVALEEGARQ
jgi:hypothetical protein